MAWRAVSISDIIMSYFKVSKLWNWCLFRIISYEIEICLELSDPFEIWQVPWHHCCGGTCQILRWYNDFIDGSCCIIYNVQAGIWVEHGVHQRIKKLDENHTSRNVSMQKLKFSEYCFFNYTRLRSKLAICSDKFYFVFKVWDKAVMIFTGCICRNCAADKYCYFSCCCHSTVDLLDIE